MDQKEIFVKVKLGNISNEAAELAKITLQLQNLKKERNELIKQANAPGHLASKEETLRLAAYNREITNQETALKNLKRIVDTSNESLDRKKALLIQLTKESNAATKAVRDQMAPGIKKLHDEISAGEQARGVFTRNVGNYPQIMQQAGGAVDKLTGSIGGATGAVGNAITSFLTAPGAIGVLAAGLNVLAKAWQRTKENIDLYLASADKVAAGPAAFELDTEKAIVDARKRARGQEAEGIRVQMEAQRQLNLFAHQYTEEQVKGLEAQVESGKKMQEQGRAFLNTLDNEKERSAWKIKYNNLLFEEEKLSDERLAKEIEWEKLEGELLKQRAIVTNQESTSAQKKAASIEADKISAILLRDKGDLVDRQRVNVEAIAEMTNKQEVYEERINALYKERQTIEKEYYSDQIKVNGLSKTSSKVTKSGDTLAESNQIGSDVQEYIDNLDKEYFKALDEKNKKEQETALETVRIQSDVSDYLENLDKEYFKALDEKADKEKEQTAKLRKEAEYRKQIEEDLQDSKMRVAEGATNFLNAIAGKNKAMQKASLVADKALAIAQIAVSTERSNAILRANAAASVLPGPGYLVRLAAAQALVTPQILFNRVAAGINIAAIIAATVAGIAGYKSGGRINRGVPVETGTKDNLLILANNREAVINERQIAALGGSGAMRRAGIPGFVNGGYIGQQAPYIPPSSTSEIINAMDGRMNRIEVSLNLHKVRSGLNELDTITTTQLI